MKAVSIAVAAAAAGVALAGSSQWATFTPVLVAYQDLCANLPQPPSALWTLPLGASTCQEVTLGGATFYASADCNVDAGTAFATFYNNPQCTNASQYDDNQKPLPVYQGTGYPACYNYNRTLPTTTGPGNPQVVGAFRVDCTTTPANSTEGVIIGFAVTLAVGLGILIAYWVYQDRQQRKKAVDTTGTVAHYQALEAEGH